jgi:hypothetical protein
MKEALRVTLCAATVCAAFMAAPASANLFDMFRKNDTSYSTHTTGSAYSTNRLTRQDIMMVQDRLAERGYYKGSIDGLYGPMTANAVRMYQRDNGLTVTGSLTMATLDGLDLATRDGYGSVADIEPAAGDYTVTTDLYVTRDVRGFGADEFDAHWSTCHECADGQFGHGGKPDGWE